MWRCSLARIWSVGFSKCSGEGWRREHSVVTECAELRGRLSLHARYDVRAGAESAHGMHAFVEGGVKTLGFRPVLGFWLVGTRFHSA